MLSFTPLKTTHTLGVRRPAYMLPHGLRAQADMPGMSANVPLRKFPQGLLAKLVNAAGQAAKFF